MRSDVVKMYKDVHTWVGITTGLALFVAFYAGAITMFEEPLKRWASPPAEAALVSLEQTPRLIEATLAQEEAARAGYTIHVKTGPETPARLSWTVWPEGRSRGAPTETYMSSFGPDGGLHVEKDETSQVAEFIDTLHRKVGLPFGHEIANPVMGAVSLLYFLAIVSGVIALLPSLVKDLFALRIGKNLKRMWLDLHNVLGLFSLPFHIIMALTAIVFAFHDEFYDLQDKVAYDGRIREMFEANEPVHHVDVDASRPFAPPAAIVEKLGEDAPGYEIRELQYIFNRDGTAELIARGEDLRYGHRGPNFGLAMVNPYTGEIMAPTYLPGRQDGWASTITSFFALHFGNFGGASVRWGYFALGLAGAFLFYSGNLLWIESRRKRRRKSDAADPQQSRSSRVMGALTVGVALGCVAGVSTTIAAAKPLSAAVGDAAVWHLWIYYAVFSLCVGWAFLRGAARGAVDLALVAAGATALIPLASLAAAIGAAPGWNHGGETLIVDLIAVVGVATLLLIARQTRRRIISAPTDSIWHAGAPDLGPAFAASAPLRTE